MKKGKKNAQRHIPDDWPVFVTGITALRRWTHPEGDQRIYLIVRSNGTFGRWTEVFSSFNDEWCWIADDRHDRRGSFYDSEDTAEREITSEYPWTQDAEPELYTNK